MINGKRPSQSLARLRRTRKVLESRVQERTAELVRVNEALQAVISGHRSAEQELQLLLSIIEAVCECEDFDSAIRLTLERVCQAIGWRYAEAWIPRPDGSAVDCSPVWYGQARGLEKFREETERIAFRSREGVIGRVFATQKPEWMRDVTTESEERFRRVKLAKEAGLGAALAVPILAGNEVLAVLCFFMREPRARDRRLVAVVSAMAMHLGSVIKHKQVDQALYESRALLDAIMDTSLAGHLSEGFAGALPVDQSAVRKALPRRSRENQGPHRRRSLATVQKLKDEIRRLTGLLRDFSSFARREICVLKPVSLTTVAGEVFALEEESYNAQHIEVEQKFAADLPLVLADRDKLKQAILNLCKNAVEAMPEGGTLTVQAREASGEVLLEISDTGAGIPDGVDVFAPFATTKPTGTGLGLMVVRQIVSAHGGTISYTGEEGKGTTFRISLPVASE